MHLKLRDLAFYHTRVENLLFCSAFVTCQEDKGRTTKSNLFEDAPHTVISSSIYYKYCTICSMKLDSSRLKRLLKLCGLRTIYTAWKSWQEKGP